jgi:hypothetical protein
LPALRDMISFRWLQVDSISFSEDTPPRPNAERQALDGRSYMNINDTIAIACYRQFRFCSYWHLTQVAYITQWDLRDQKMHTKYFTIPTTVVYLFFIQLYGDV